MLQYFENLFRSLLGSDLLFEIILCLLIFFIFVFVAKIISFFIKKILKPFTRKTETIYDDLIIEIIESGARKLLTLLGAYIALIIFKDGFALLDIAANKTLIQKHPYLNEAVFILENALFVVLIILLLIICNRLIAVAFDWYAEHTDAGENKDLSGSLFPLLKKVSKLLMTILAFVIVLAKFKIDISAFVVSLGVGSLAIALAAQETLSNMISGFIIMIDRPFRIGDRIKIGTEINGDVVGIGIRSTKVLDFDKNILIIPNNDIVKSRIINYTYPTTLTRVVVDVPVAYSNNIDNIKMILTEIARSDRAVDLESPVEVSLTKFGDSFIEYKIAVKTADYREAFDLGCRIREAVFNKFRAEGIDFPMPKRQVFIEAAKQ